MLRGLVTAFARRQRTGGDPPPDDDADDKADEDKPAADTPSTKSGPADTTKDLPAIQPPEPKAEPWPDATPQPMRPVEPAAPPVARARTETALAPTASDFGAPPAMPVPTAAAPAPTGDVTQAEDPTNMPGPREIPDGNPTDPARPPGLVPRGDSRSLRRPGEFALIYRRGSFVISRFGALGTRGQWRVVEYPTPSAAANSYAKESSRFVSDGFSDYRG
jgi:hypothetical protein